MKKLLFIALSLSCVIAQGQFTPNNLAVLKITNAGTALTNSGIAYPVSIVEFSTAGVPTATNINLTGGTPNFTLEERTVTHEGQLNLSSDRNFLSAVGYNAAIGAVSSVFRVTEKRVARIDATGTVNLSTGIPTAQGFNNVSIRSAVSINGTNYWVQSATPNAAHGVRTVAHGTITSGSFTPGTGSGYRSITLSDGFIYSTQGASPVVNVHDAAGVATPINFSSVIATPEYSQMVFLDADPAIPGNDLLYIADRVAGVRKFILTPGTPDVWTTTSGGIGFPQGANGGYHSITGRIEGGKPTLYAIKMITSGNSYLVKIVDEGTRTHDWSVAPFPTISVLASTNNTEQFKGVAFTPGSLFVLPVKLTSFEGFLLKEDVMLKWVTSYESNSDKYIVERSSDALLFETVGTIASLNLANGGTYEFTDQNLKEGMYYYRLKSTDKDGRFTYSKIINFRIKDEVGAAISVFPNPVMEQLNVSYPTSTKQTSIRIVDMAGKVLINRNVLLGTRQLSVDVSALAKGIYTLILYKDDSKLSSQFVKP